MNKKIKRDDTVVLYSSDPRQKPEVTQVTGIGKKYITVNASRDHNRYDVNDYRCVDWLAWSLFPGTVEEYEEYVKHQEEATELRRKLLNRINCAEYDELKAIYNFLYPAQ